MKSFDLLSIGTCYLDINSWDYDLSQGLQWETVVENHYYEFTPGGSAVNFAKLIANLDLKPVFIGKTGTDMTGSQLKDSMQKKGIHPALIQDDSVITNLSINLSAKTGKTIMLELGSANQNLTAEEVISQAKEFLPQVSYLYLGGCLKLKNLIPIYPELIQLAHKYQVRVVIDHGKATNKTSQQDILAMQSIIMQLNETDSYIPSDTDVYNVWQVDTIQQAIEKLRSKTKVTIIITEAEKGAYGLQNGTAQHVPAYQVYVKNSIGAGDAFNAGFIKAQMDGMAFLDSIQFGNATAALKISQDQLPTFEQIHELITTKC